MTRTSVSAAAVYPGQVHVCACAHTCAFRCRATVSMSGPFTCACLLSSLRPSLTPFLPLSPRSYKTDCLDINYIVVSNRLRQLTVREGLSGVSCAHVALIQDAAAFKTLEHYLLARIKGERFREREAERERAAPTNLDRRDCLCVALVNFFLQLRSLYFFFCINLSSILKVCVFYTNNFCARLKNAFLPTRHSVNSNTGCMSTVAVAHVIGS